MVFHVFTLVLCYADEVILILLGFLRLVKKSRLIFLVTLKVDSYIGKYSYLDL